MDVAGRPKLCGVMIETNLNRLHCRRVFRGREMIECPVSKEMDLTAAELLSWRAMDFVVKEMDRSSQ